MAGVHAHPWRTGKCLFDILNQLPNFGVGRIVTRTRWQHLRPDTPSYFRITRVKVNCESPNLAQGEAWGEPTMLGYSRDGMEVKIGAWWKREWKLIRKSEEDEFCAYTPKETDFHAVPNHAPMPPLLAAIIKEEKQARGEEVEEPLLFDINPRNGYKHRGYQIPGAGVVGQSIGEFEAPSR